MTIINLKNPQSDKNVAKDILHAKRIAAQAAAASTKGDKGDKGDTGTTGATGPAVQLQATTISIQWKYTSSATWNDLIALSELTGPAGVDGADGTNGVGIPVGGTTGQILAKNSTTDYDTEWIDQTGGGGTLNDLTDVDTTGVTDGQVLTYDSSTSSWIPSTIVSVAGLAIASLLQFGFYNLTPLDNLSTIVSFTAS